MEGLTPDRLVALVDELRVRGVVRFAIGAVSVELAPQAVHAGMQLDAAKAKAAQGYRLAEAGNAAAIAKEAAAAAAVAREREALASA